MTANFPALLLVMRTANAKSFWFARLIHDYVERYGAAVLGRLKQMGRTSSPDEVLPPARDAQLPQPTSECAGLSNHTNDLVTCRDALWERVVLINQCKFSVLPVLGCFGA